MSSNEGPLCPSSEGSITLEQAIIALAERVTALEVLFSAEDTLLVKTSELAENDSKIIAGYDVLIKQILATVQSHRDALIAHQAAIKEMKSKPRTWPDGRTTLN